MSLLQLENTVFASEGGNIIDNISLSIEHGDFVSIVGPSGSGKSTLLKLCCHLISPTSGSISYKGRNVSEYSPTELRKSITYCFQTPYLFGETVWDNFAFPYSIRNIKPDKGCALELMEKFNLPGDFVKKNVKNLSGGEKQRVALIRTLLFMPDILLLDEITSALDTDNTRLVEEVVSGLNRDGTTVLWVTHNLEQSRRNASRLVALEAGRIKSMEDIS